MSDNWNPPFVTGWNILSSAHPGHIFKKLFLAHSAQTPQQHLSTFCTCIACRSCREVVLTSPKDFAGHLPSSPTKISKAETSTAWKTSPSYPFLPRKRKAAAFVAEVVFCLVVSSLGQSLIRWPRPPQYAQPCHAMAAWQSGSQLRRKLLTYSFRYFSWKPARLTAATIP